MKHCSPLKIAVLAVVLVSLAEFTLQADENDKKTVVTLDQPTEVPGIVLAPGTYIITLLNSTSNRHIVEIFNAKMDHLYALTFTVAAAKVQQSGKTVLTFYEGGQGHPQAMRRWFWPGEVDGQEFVYPKGQAAEISGRTKEKVPEGQIPTVSESGQSLVPDNAKGR